MKRFLLLITLLLSVSIMFFGTVSAQGKPEKAKKKAAVEATGAALWDHLKQVDYTKKWRMWPGKTALYKGTEPHGVLLTTYVNGPAYRAIMSKRGMLPDSSIVVKENYSLEKKLVAITVMYKVKGYNPQAGDWFWTKYAPDGKIEAEGKVDGCIKCHAAKKDNDYIFTGPLKEGL